jgi:hypothetical protein
MLSVRKAGFKTTEQKNQIEYRGYRLHPKYADGVFILIFRFPGV